ncbi:MAG TPA: cupin [Fastidiosipila sp.]|nr:cupin [Fastidiosipila sp.]
MHEIKEILIEEKAPFPNSRHPVLFYPQALDPAEQCFTDLFAKNGWTGIWVNGVYRYDHFHVKAHEALGCIKGWVKVRLGGPDGDTYTLKAGDAVLLPAGTGHRNIESSADFQIVGAYPPGQSPDLQTGDMARYDALKKQAASLELPETDPVSGKRISWSD